MTKGIKIGWTPPAIVPSMATDTMQKSVIYGHGPEDSRFELDPVTPGISQQQSPIVPKQLAPKSQFNIDEANKALSEGRYPDAMFYLEGVTGAWIRKGEPELALDCLGAAKEMSETRFNDTTFRTELRLAGHAHALGREDLVDYFFSRTHELIERTSDEFKKEEICFATGITYAKIQRFDKAFELTELVQDRFNYYRVIAEKIIEQGNAELAEEIILNKAVPAARAELNRIEYGMPHLIYAAEMLMKMGKAESAKALLDEVAQAYHAISWHQIDLKFSYRSNAEKTAVLYAQLGFRDEAIDMVNRGWFREDVLNDITPEELQTHKLERIKDHWKNLWRALNQ
ncbi:MAG: hypothetical protein ABIE74_00840 [Pseudomonadota bacterium]